MIEVENLTKRYGNFTAIEDVTFNVAEGEVVGFLGPNAAGKTTTMRILTGFMPATDGTAKVAGYEVFENSIDVRRQIGYMPENVPLYTEMTVKSYLHFMAKLNRVHRKRRRERVNLTIEACGLGDYRNRIIGKLSKGYRQRVGLAQALVHDPQVLILDEPTIGLDPRQIIEIRNLIKSLGGEHTVILSTHILPEASMICNRIIIINEGRIAGEVLLKDGVVTCIEFRNPQALLFSIGSEHYVDLDCEAITEGLRREFESNKRPLSQNADVMLKEKGSDWLITDKDNKMTYFIREDEGKLNVYTGTMDLGESGNVYMQVRGPSEKVHPRLELTQNVIGVRLEKEDDGVGTYIVTHAPGADIRAELTSLIVYSGWELLELRPAEMTLEEAFLELTREEVVSE
jgi:ABC-type multidrug transport system ATPase subunit